MCWPLSIGFPRQESWNELPFPSPGDIPDPGIELLHWQVSHQESPRLLNKDTNPIHEGGPSYLSHLQRLSH